ncbi:hypothetical protein GCM10008995_01060 [Halobellus salinus]|uniref:Uncharacterized protein n=1 Tax=Halobellus salinus TaxID=931585 RepID=A0A830E6P1_9EURY|nr:hypothetical protein [Halobellus salinus]GGI94613.1 hypothetical protein GCM10008995_01060 [Halobellus salinus]SMP20147.1 hypothetical protein SAMN06265347_107110 [Halobellus salinus]
MREDELATAVVDHFEATFDDPEIRLEEPYNHYGTRGVVDVYARTAPPERVSYLAELKADPAVRMASGANEILRQYRRAERYFFRDDAHDLRTRLGRDGPGLRLLLLFAPTVGCVEHVLEHRSLYASVAPELSVDGVSAARTVAFLVNLDNASHGGLGFCSVNGDVDVQSAAFREAVPEGSRLAAAIDEADVDADA